MSEAGFGEGDYQNLFATEEQCAGILADRRVRACKFTGSTAGGKNVAVLCAQNMKKGCFELGGSDPFVVLKDADLERAVEAAYASRMGNTGQACINAKRFIVASPVYDEFRDRLVEKIRSTAVIGDPMEHATNVGPLAMARAKENLLRQLAMATSEGGARVTHGDLGFDIGATNPELKDGNYVEPIVLEGMSPESNAYHEELFGPVFNLFKVGTSEEALDLANNSDYGLASTVFTEDPDEAANAAKHLSAGSVFVNDCVASGSEYPGGGIKGSGYGRECYSDGLLDTANRKTIITRNRQ